MRPCVLPFYFRRIENETIDRKSGKTDVLGLHG